MSTSVALRPRRTSRATLLSYNKTKPSPLSSFSYFDSNGAGNYCPLCAKREFCDQQREGPRANKEKRKSGARGGKRTAAATLWAVLSYFSNSFQSVQDWKGWERMVALGAQRTAPICGARRRTQGRRRGRCERRWSRRGRGRHCARWRGRGPCRRRRACGPR